MLSNKKGFTIMEIMTVIFIIGLLAAAIYIGTTPYYQRSRDAGRLVQVQSYASVFTTYKQSADVFPTTYWSGASATDEWWCISEIFSRNDGITVDSKFSTLSKGVSNPPMDPLGRSAKPIPKCDINWSYFYNRLEYLGEQAAIIAARTETKGSANLGDYNKLNTSDQLNILYNNTKRGTVQPEANDAIFFMALK